MWGLESIILVSFAAVVGAATVAHAYYLLWSARRDHKAALDKGDADFITILRNGQPPIEPGAEIAHLPTWQVPRLRQRRRSW